MTKKTRYYVDPKKMIPKKPLVQRIPWNRIFVILLLGAFITGGYGAYRWADATAYLILEYNTDGELTHCTLAPEKLTGGCRWDGRNGSCGEDPVHFYGHGGKRVDLRSSNVELLEIGSCNSADEVMRERSIPKEKCLILLETVE